MTKIDGLKIMETPAVCAINAAEILILGGWAEDPEKIAHIYDLDKGKITFTSSDLALGMTCWSVPSLV